MVLRMQLLFVGSDCDDRDHWVEKSVVPASRINQLSHEQPCAMSEIIVGQFGHGMRISEGDCRM